MRKRFATEEVETAFAKSIFGPTKKKWHLWKYSHRVVKEFVLAWYRLKAWKPPKPQLEVSYGNDGFHAIFRIHK